MEKNADKDKRWVARTQRDYMKIRQEYSSGGCSWYRNVGHKISLWRIRLEIKIVKIKLRFSYQKCRWKMIKFIGYIHDQAH